MPLNPREKIFIGVRPTGIGYCDQTKEVGGDYKKLAFLPFRELVLKIEPDCPAELEAFIRQDAQGVIDKRGEAFPVSTCGQTVILGS